MAALRVTVVKPDWGIRGGAEVVVERIEAELRARGHSVDRRSIPVPGLPRRAFGVAVPDGDWNRAPEYFRYLATLEAVRGIDLTLADVVVSTHGPSFAVDHPRHLNVFFHHLRVFYDLDEVSVAAGLAGDPEVHAAARQHIRSLDQAALEGVTWFSPNSEVTAGRLASFNGLTNATVHHAGVDLPAQHVSADAPRRGAVLCVSRSEFSKRTELFVEAMHLLGSHHAVLAGDGGRLPWVQHLDRQLASGALAPGGLTAGETWCNPGRPPASSLVQAVLRRLPIGARPAPVPAGQSPVTIAGRVDDAELARLYREAPCVMAPAFDEDYGLTALEAMAHGCPVVVAKDGGGLTTIVEDGVTGMVVEPTADAFATAVRRLLDEPEWARSLGAAGRERAATFTWERFTREFLIAFDRVVA